MALQLAEGPTVVMADTAARMTRAARTAESDAVEYTQRGLRKWQRDSKLATARRRGTTRVAVSDVRHAKLIPQPEMPLSGVRAKTSGRIIWGECTLARPTRACWLRSRRRSRCGLQSMTN